MLPALNADQAEAVREISQSGRGIEAVIALAGTGKTTLVGALATAYRNAGWHVIGTAPTARAARQLCEQAGRGHHHPCAAAPSHPRRRP